MKIAKLSLLSIGILLTVGCHTQHFLNPNEKPYLVHNGTTQCVALPLSEYNSSPSRTPSAGYDQDGDIVLLRCGFTPSQAADYADKVNRALDYRP